MIRRLFSKITNKIYELPVLVLMPHSRCNCRCVMCDIWMANHEKKEISLEVLREHVSQFVKLRVREVVLSGGEALMHANLWALCALLQENKMRVVLLTTGLLLERNAEEILRHTNEVIVSLDGSREVHDQIRRVPNAFEKLSQGVRRLKTLQPSFRITARCVLQRNNFFDFNQIVRSAREIGLDSISFLAADVSTTAFNRPEHWDSERVGDVALSLAETSAFEALLKESFHDFQFEYDSKFIAENPAKMMRIVAYYKAINKSGEFPEPICNAPWVSAVIESNGDILPCFFHKPYGNIYEGSFTRTINSPAAIQFRRTLKVKSNPVCKKCVCSLKLGLTQLS
jgi:Fe-coproporphyrin III synthase